MTFGTKYDYTIPTGEVNSGEVLIEEQNFVSAEARIKAIMYSGRLLSQASPSDFDSYGLDVDSFENEEDFEIGYRNESDLVDIDASLKRVDAINSEIVKARTTVSQPKDEEKVTE